MPPRVFQRRKKDASSSSSRRSVAHEPPTRVGESTPESFGFRLRDPAHLTTFHQLKEKEWKGTRHLDFHLLSELGIRTDVERLASALGWDDFLSFSEPTYKGLTLEFLSTLNVQTRGGPEVAEGICTFQLGGSKRTLTLNEINQIFGFPVVNDDVARCESRAIWCPNNFWDKIATGSNYNPSSSKASCITNPAIRIFQRFMAHTIFGRADGENNFPRKELVMIAAALSRRSVNSAGFLMHHLATVSHRGKGGIGIGGIVTKFARYYQIPLTRPADIESTPLDFNALHHMRIIYQLRGDYCWLIGSSKRLMRLPDVSRTSLTTEANWSISVRRNDLRLEDIAIRKRPLHKEQSQEESDEEGDEEEERNDGVEEEAADEMDYIPDGRGQQSNAYSDPRFDTVMETVSGLRSHMDEQFRLLGERQDEHFRQVQEKFQLLNTRFDAWNPYGWQHGFPPPPPPDM